MITKERLDELFEFDYKIGFTNKISRGRACKHSRSGYVDVHGYRRIVIDYIKYYEHHLVWFYVTGQWPQELDHKDGDRANNAFSNLRECTRTENNFNAERATGISGLRGAYWDSRVSKWYSKIQVGGQVRWLGSYNTSEEAHCAFMIAVEQTHKEFAVEKRKELFRRRF